MINAPGAASPIIPNTYTRPATLWDRGNFVRTVEDI